MAVAVKTSPGSRSTGPLSKPAVVSLIGVVYVVACFALLFALVPSLWWSAWEGMKFQSYRFIGGTLLLTLSIAIAIALFVVGARLLGPNPPKGVRAGVLLGFLTVLGVLLLARWASVWIEHWAYDSRLFGESTGAIITAIVFAVFLGGGLYFFTRPGTQKFAVNVEDAGWFSTTSYKANQGHRVRRGTIFGILLLVGAGVYTMITHGVLTRGNPDLALNIPFTGAVAIESFGDARQFIAELPAENKNTVKVRYAGEEKRTRLRVDQTVSYSGYVDAVEAVVATSQALEEVYRKAISERNMEQTDYLQKLHRDVIWPKVTQLLDRKVLGEGATRRVRVIYDQSTWEDASAVLAAIGREYASLASKEKPDLGAEVYLPVAVLLVDRYLLRDINDQTADTANVKVRDPGESGFKYGQIVKRVDFDAKVTELKKLAGSPALPTFTALEPAWGPSNYATLTLLPAIQFTLPLLLLAGSLWLAWRVVNLPAFADFLIATEAELNKVSWTTQKRLVQDTIVVLVTVVLMAVFLFAMDWTWKVVLSFKSPYFEIGVLHIPPEGGQQNKKVEEKRW